MFLVMIIVWSMTVRAPRILVAASALAVAVLLSGCGALTGDRTAAGSQHDGGRLAVVATTPVIADFVREIGGAHVSVTEIVKPNVDPHDYEPTPADLQAIADAAVVVENGVGLEKWLDATVSAAGFTGPVVDASRGVPLRNGVSETPGTSTSDPHIWHNPRNAQIMVANIERALASKDPGDAAAYRAAFTAYAKKLEDLDKANEKAFASIPAAKRQLVTDHDAFGYYADRYGIRIVGSVIPTMDTSAALSAKQLADLVAKIKATGTPAIFTESSLPPKTADAVARQAGVKVIGGPDALYGDSLGPVGTAGGTYLGAEQHNTATIVAALHG